MHTGHSRPAVVRRPIGRLRLLVVGLAPLAVLPPLTALAASTGIVATSSSTVWSRSWNPALALLSSYSAKSTSTAGFLALWHPIVASGAQRLTVTVQVRTRWVDSKATVDSPNILQEGLYRSSAQ